MEKAEHIMVSPSDLKVGDILIEKKKDPRSLPDFARRIISINLNESVDNPNGDSVDIMTAYPDGNRQQEGMAIPKNSDQLEIVRPASEQTQEDVFKRIARENAEARQQFGEKQQKPTSEILEEMKGKTVGDLKEALGIRNDYLVTQIQIYKEFVDQAESQGFKREAEKAQLKQMVDEQEENAAKSRELLSRQSYEIYE